MTRITPSIASPSGPSATTLRRAAVSLVEVLVVISMILLLLAILIPSLGEARHKARRVLCKNNLKQWGNAAVLFVAKSGGYLPTEGNYFPSGIQKDGTWYNELPPLVGLPKYRDVERIEDKIKEFPGLSTWICPSKNQTRQFKSSSGKNQFHYGMNRVLDGVGTESNPSEEVPGFLDTEKPVPMHRYARKPLTVFLFDIAANSPNGGPREVATSYQRDFSGNPMGRFHGDYANVLFIDGSAGWCTTDDLVTNRDFRGGDILWHNSRVYWGFPRPGTQLPADYYEDE